MKTKKTLMYKVNLLDIDGAGDFPCPNCGVTFSPEDMSNEVYEIIETKLRGEELEELLLLCHKCGSSIRLFGFIKT